ncbi:hypothetical protein [Sphingomonas sp. CLY1604]|uniref:hypothetical protein n=1 Tax=Sphingomonas sp. CLY1604 TaxID=3457786 RepID=UPI003FD82191
MSRFLRNLGLSLLLVATCAVRATPAQFDLTGPRLDVAVTRGGATLPLEWVPNLAEGDRIAIKLDLPAGQTDRFRLVAAFLRGATDRPPRDWFHDTLSGKAKNGDLSLVVPKGAQQLALFVLPERGGGANAIVSAVRKQPGTFVRAVQDLNQASLDRARLDTFLDLLLQAAAKDPESVNATSQMLTRSLSIKLKAECLQQPADLQAACLTGDRETLLFADTHSSALADTLAGAPTDLAFQISATPQGGYGTYSSYIGVMRDIFRLFGAFQSTQLQFVPALARMGGDRITLLLNTPLSFGKPASVMVIGLPAIEAPKPPPLRATDGSALLCARADAVLPVEGAPLVYATRYAHDMRVRVTRQDGTPIDLPVHADPRRGGFVLDRALPDQGFAPVVEARLHGNWGFTPFEGPRLTLSDPRVNRWAAPAGASLVVGRDNSLELTGDGAGCIGAVTMRRGDGAPQPLTWKQSGQHAITLAIPLDKATPGPVTLTVSGSAQAAPVTLTLPALQEVGRLDDLTLAAGDDEAVLTGSRLDQVRSVTIGKATLQPGALSRADGSDRLVLVPADPAALRALGAGTRLAAAVTFTGDRHKTVPLTVAPARPDPVLLQRSARPPQRTGALAIALSPDDAFAQDAAVSFAFRLDAGSPLTGREIVEVAAADGGASVQRTAGKGYDVQDATTGIVSLVPRDRLGPLVHGRLRFRVIQGGVASRWAPLGTAIRLPEVHGLTCPSATRCILDADRLFLVRAIATDDRFATVQAVPDGFTGNTLDLTIPATAKAKLYLRLRDAPEAIGMVSPGAP